MDKLKSLGKRLFSMQFALLLLALLTIACIAGSVIPQGDLESYYQNTYSPSMVHLILLLGLDDVFHCWWFVVLTIVLCLNLLGCNIVHAPVLMRRWKTGFLPPKHFSDFKEGSSFPLASDPETLFAKMGFRKVQKLTTPEGRTFLYSVRNKIGIWGAWLTHLGMLIIIAGFALGQMYTIKYTVYGVEGSTKPVEDTSYTLTIDSFETTLREDETVDQYTSLVTVTDTTSCEAQQTQTSVNHPGKVFGMQVYQNSTGWAATVTVSKDKESVSSEPSLPEEIQSAVLCAGEYLEVEDKPGLVILFNAFYPDYAKDANGMPVTVSPHPVNPAYLYTVYYNNKVIGMNVLHNDYISIDDYIVTFDSPQQYTLLQLKRDPYTWLAAIGGILICIALLIAFYIRTEELWTLQKEDGSWIISGYSRKGGLLFLENLKSNLETSNHQAVRNEDKKK